MLLLLPTFNSLSAFGVLGLRGALPPPEMTFGELFSFEGGDDDNDASLLFLLLDSSI